MAFTSQNISILVVLLYSWQINVNSRKFQVLGDVYYGVQISYYAIIGSQLSIVALSIVLIAGINSVSWFWFLSLLNFKNYLKHSRYSWNCLPGEHWSCYSVDVRYFNFHVTRSCCHRLRKHLEGPHKWRKKHFALMISVTYSFIYSILMDFVKQKL